MKPDLGASGLLEWSKPLGLLIAWLLYEHALSSE